MQLLQLKVPPPLVALLIAGLMWCISLFTQTIELPAMGRVGGAAAIALAGGAFSLAGALSFRRAKTTVNPMKPEKTSSFVTSGIYTVTRNPMYLGMLFVLVAWALFLSSAWALFGPLSFFIYMNSFQIAPEEKVLAAMFGPAYAAYTATVRRWL